MTSAYNRIVERVDAVLDASFWINAERSGLTPHLLDYFRLFVPPLVARELRVLVERVADPPPAATLFAVWQGLGHVEVVPPTWMFARFDAGEDEAIALAQERDWVLLIDDARPRDYSRGPLRLRVFDSPAFAVLLYQQGRLSYETVVAALQRSQANRRVVTDALISLERWHRRRGGE